MRIVFMGTPEFAVASLEALLRSKHEVVGVVTATDKLGGRGGKQLLQSAVKKFALEHQLNILQPEKLKSPEFIRELMDLRADIFIVVAFRMLPEVIWNMPPLGTYNIHGSLLPKYRGAAPINWAIIRGEKETGVSFFKLKHEIDTGNVLLQAKLTIDENDDFGSIYQKMESLGAQTLIQGLEIIENGNLQFLEQDEEHVSRAPKIFHEDCRINFHQSCDEVHNFIRGLCPVPAAFFDFEGMEMKVYKSRPEVINHKESIGSVIFSGKKSLKIACNDGFIHLLEVKPEGKRQMAISDFLNGYAPS